MDNNLINYRELRCAVAQNQSRLCFFIMLKGCEEKINLR